MLKLPDQARERMEKSLVPKPEPGGGGHEKKLNVESGWSDDRSIAVRWRLYIILRS